MQEKEFSKIIREILSEEEEKELTKYYIEYYEAKTKFYVKVAEMLDKDNSLNEKLMKFYFLPS